MENIEQRPTFNRSQIIPIKNALVIDNYNVLSDEEVDKTSPRNISKPIDSPLSRYELQYQSFDPHKGSPPNEFMNKLQQRFNQSLGIRCSNCVTK